MVYLKRIATAVVIICFIASCTNPKPTETLGGSTLANHKPSINFEKLKKLDTAFNYYCFGIAPPSKAQYALCEKMNVHLIAKGCVQDSALVAYNQHVDRVVAKHYGVSVLELLSE